MVENCYLMRKNEERCYLRYLFTVDGAEKIVSVELIPTIGLEHRVYERCEEGDSLKYWTKTHIIKPILPQRKGEDFRAYIERIGTKEKPKEGELFQDYLKRMDRNNWRESEPTLVDRLGVNDPIVRDAFNEGTTAEDLFISYKLVQERRGDERTFSKGDLN